MGRFGGGSCAARVERSGAGWRAAVSTGAGPMAPGARARAVRVRCSRTPWPRGRIARAAPVLVAAAFAIMAHVVVVRAGIWGSSKSNSERRGTATREMTPAGEGMLRELDRVVDAAGTDPAMRAGAAASAAGMGLKDHDADSPEAGIATAVAAAAAVGFGGSELSQQQPTGSGGVPPPTGVGGTSVRGAAGDSRALAHGPLIGTPGGLPVTPSAIVEGAGRVWVTYGEPPAIETRGGYPLCARGGLDGAWMFPTLQSKRDVYGRPIVQPPRGDPRVSWAFDASTGLWSAVRSLFDQRALPSPSARGQAALVAAVNSQRVNSLHRHQRTGGVGTNGPVTGSGPMSVSALRAADSRNVLSAASGSRLARQSRELPVSLGGCSHWEGPGPSHGSLDGTAYDEQGGGGGGAPRRMLWYHDTLVFYIGCSGTPTQRFFNGLRWVYTPLYLPAWAGEAVSLGRIADALLAISASGDLFVAHVEPVSCAWETMVCDSEGNALLAWHQVRPPAVLGRAAPATATGGSAATGSVFFVSRDGEVYELIGLRKPQWRQHKRPMGVLVGALAGAGDTAPGSLFIVSTAGDLYEYSWEVSCDPRATSVRCLGAPAHKPARIRECICRVHAVASEMPMVARLPSRCSMADHISTGVYVGTACRSATTCVVALVRNVSLALTHPPANTFPAQYRAPQYWTAAG